MEVNEFVKLRNEFEKADLQRKIEIYAYTENLTQEQYKSLLMLYPMDKLVELEKALK